MIWGVRAPAQVSPCIILKGERDKKKRIFLLRVFFVMGGFHVLEFDQHDLCLSRILPKAISMREERGGEKREKKPQPISRDALGSGFHKYVVGMFAEFVAQQSPGNARKVAKQHETWII